MNLFPLLIFQSIASYSNGKSFKIVVCGEGRLPVMIPTSDEDKELLKKLNITIPEIGTLKVYSLKVNICKEDFNDLAESISLEYIYGNDYDDDDKLTLKPRDFEYDKVKGIKGYKYHHSTKMYGKLNNSKIDYYRKDGDGENLYNKMKDRKNVTNDMFEGSNTRMVPIEDFDFEIQLKTCISPGKESLENNGIVFRFERGDGEWIILKENKDSLLIKFCTLDGLRWFRNFEGSLLLNYLIHPTKKRIFPLLGMFPIKTKAEDPKNNRIWGLLKLCCQNIVNVRRC